MVHLAASCSYLLASSDCFGWGRPGAAYPVTSYPFVDSESHWHMNIALRSLVQQTNHPTLGLGPSDWDWDTPGIALGVSAVEAAAEGLPYLGHQVGTAASAQG